MKSIVHLDNFRTFILQGAKAPCYLKTEKQRSYIKTLGTRGFNPLPQKALFCESSYLVVAVCDTYTLTVPHHF